jgi:tetratricopeptide (TPR) repeat protein
MRASQQMRVHKFNQAKTDLNQARKLGAPLKKILDLTMDIDWNLGHYEKALKLAQETLVRNPNRLNLIHLAGLEHELGLIDQANTHYQSAKLVTDDGVYLNPIQLAWLEVQIGINFFKMKNYLQSELAFKSAIAIAPNFNMALEHLAETLAYVNRIDESITLYEKIITQSDDPEFMGQLAKLYRYQNRIDESNKLAFNAKVKYLQLLKDFPEAMYWHASHFFLEEGKDPQLALHLLEMNAKLRPNSNSFLALAKTQLNLNLKAQAKKSIIKVLKMAPTSTEICELAKELINNPNRLFNQKCKIKK